MKTLIELFQKRADVTCKLTKTTQTETGNNENHVIDPFVT